MDNTITLDQLKDIDPRAHKLALEVVAWCVDETNTPTPSDFRVFKEPNGSFTLQWVEHGTGAPEWAWDAGAGEWVDSEEDYDRFLALGDKD